MQGRSFLPLVQKKPVDWPDEVFVQISEAEVGRAVRTRRWKYSVADPDRDSWGDEGDKSDRYVETYLYDLLSDPYELHNLIEYDSHAEVRNVMRERLLRRMGDAGESLPKIDPAPTRPGGQRRVLGDEALE
jgi:arylsulfatase A-like enzyme